MKLVILIYFSLLSIFVNAQDTIRIPQSEIDEIIAVIDTLIEQDSINNLIVIKQKNQLENYKLLSQQDSLILSFKNKEINLYKEQIQLYEDKNNIIDRWWNKRSFGFTMGILSTLSIIYFLDYTLPK